MDKVNITKTNFYSNTLMIVTSIHHVYGAWIYHTPWRRHVLFVSVPVIVITILLNRRLSKKESSRSSFLFWLYWLITFIASIGIGLFEGIYNHLLKDILFYAGVDHAILLQMFPPPAYEMPNEFFFEFTGVLQAFIFIPLAFYFFRLTKKHFGNLIARRSV